MATATVSGNLRDFSDQPPSNPRMWVHPQRPGYGANGRLFTDQPIPVQVSAGGQFSVPLEEHHVYRIETQGFDEGHDRVSRSWWSEPFRVPTGGGTIAQIIGLPYRTGQVRVLQTPPPSTVYDDYVYDETTGILYERRS